MDFAIDDFKPLLFFVVGAFLIVFVIARELRRRRILRNFKEVTGTIVDQKVDSRGGLALSYPVVRFDSDAGTIIERYKDASSPKKYFLYQDVTVQYSLDNPKEFLIKGDNSIWIEFAIMSLGIAFVFYSIIVILGNNAKNNWWI